MFKFTMTHLHFIVFVTLVAPSLLMMASFFVQREHVLVTGSDRHVVRDSAVWSVYPHTPSSWFAELLDAEMAALPHANERTIERCVVSLRCVYKKIRRDTRD